MNKNVYFLLICQSLQRIKRILWQPVVTYLPFNIRNYTKEAKKAYYRKLWQDEPSKEFHTINLGRFSFDILQSGFLSSLSNPARKAFFERRKRRMLHALTYSCSQLRPIYQFLNRYWTRLHWVRDSVYLAGLGEIGRGHKKYI